MHEKDSDDEEETEYCDVRNNDEKVKMSNETEELTEITCEQEHFNLLIDERVCNNLCNFCFHDLTYEENKILQDEEKENAK